MWPRVSKLHASGFSCSECSLGALRNHLALMLRNCGQDVNGETVGGRHIDRYELAVTVHQSGDEMDITGKSVELCDDQSCLLQAAFSQSGHQLWSIRFTTTLDFDIFGNDRAAIGNIAGNGFPLGIHAQAEDALLVRRNSQICNVFLQTIHSVMPESEQYRET